MCVLSHFSRVRLLATLWTIVHQALLSMGFSRQEYWSGLPCPSPGDLPDQGSNRRVLGLLNWQAHERHRGSPAESESHTNLMSEK